LSVIARYLTAMILRNRGQNQQLADEITEKLSPESQERLYRIFQDHEDEVRRLRQNQTMAYAVAREHRRMGVGG
jgi:hypothetical protein